MRRTKIAARPEETAKPVQIRLIFNKDSGFCRMIAGIRDTIVPIDFTRRVYAAIAAPKTLEELPVADHNDYELLAGDEVIQSILTFVRRL